MAKVNNANPKVTAIFPVTLTPSGVSPNRFKNQMKKKTVNRKFMYFPYFFSPIFGLAISSRIYSIMGSKKRPTQLGIPHDWA